MLFEEFKKRVAAATPEFLKIVARSVIEPVWNSPKGHKYLTVKRIRDPFNNRENGYYFSERKGVDSIAFICRTDEHPDHFLILSQWHGPLQRFNEGSFTGSLDKPGASLLQILSEELIEEAGLAISEAELETRAQYCGAHVVGGNTNEQVHLYCVDITGIPFETRHPENEFEASMTQFFAPKKYIYSKCEWKAQLIAAKSGSPYA